VAFLYRLLRPLLFLFDAETAHRLVAWFLRRLRPRPALTAPLEARVLGLTFPSPVGLAAGMDKGEALTAAWFRLGFGFVEIGTVTPRSQPGNPRPRLFRLRRDSALVNRMGFNNDGAEAVAARLQRSVRAGPVGVNIGRNKDTPNERAAGDYVDAFRALAPHADYVAVNVSSPNTPGLRALQGAEEIAALLRALAAARDALPRRVPLLVKVSPDEPDGRLDALADAALAAGADGFIATNTTAVEQGGLSGKPLAARALRACARLWLRTRAPIIGVGGIFTAEDAYQRIRAGASLLQIYTALVYEGPAAPRRIAEGLRRLLERDGLTLEQAVGRDAEALGR